MADDFELKAQQIFKDIWSPYCPGVSLLECPSSKAEDLREVIRTRLKNGEDTDSIMSGLKAEYGSSLRMQPSFEGRESLAYSLPWIGIFFAVSILLIFLLVRRATKKVALEKVPPTKKPDAEVLKQILKDMNE